MPVIDREWAVVPVASLNMTRFVLPDGKWEIEVIIETQDQFQERPDFTNLVHIRTGTKICTIRYRELSEPPKETGSMPPEETEELI